MKAEIITGLIMKSLIEDESCLVSFLNKVQEEEYEKLDSLLHQEIDSIAAKRHNYQESYYQSDDWWPNHLRGVELGHSIYTDELAQELKGILRGKFKKFRIILHVYSDICDGTTFLFSVLISSSKIWVTKDNLGS